MDPVYPYPSSMYHRSYNTAMFETASSPVQAALHMIPTSNSRDDSLNAPRRSLMPQVSCIKFAAPVLSRILSSAKP